MKFAPILLASLTACLSSTSAQADVSVTTSPSAPVDRLFLSIVPGAHLDTQWRNSAASPDGRRDVGQSFLINESVILESLTLRVKLFGEGAPGSSFTLSVYKFDSKEHVTPAGDPLYSSGGQLPVDLSEDQYLTFTLDDPLELQAGEYYGFILTFPEMRRRRTVNFYSRGATGAPNFGSPLYYQYSAAAGDNSDAEEYTWQMGVNALEMYAVATAERGSAALSNEMFSTPLVGIFPMVTR